LENIRIQFFGSIRAAAQTPETQAAPAENTTVLQLLRELAERYGDTFRGEIFTEDGESLREDLTVARNGTITKHGAAGETLLQPGDILALFPLFPGGG